MKSRSIATRRWWREPTRQVVTPLDAERFIEQVGFASCLTDSRRPGPSLYVAVCGRRDAVMPRNVQKDPEASLTWNLKDELLRRGKVYYAKLARGKATFIAPRMIPYFHAIWGMRRAEEAAAAQQGRPRHPQGAAPRMGDGHRGPARGVRREGSRHVHPRARRAAGGDDRDPWRRRSTSRSRTSGRLASAGFPTACAAASTARPPSARSRAVSSPVQG